MLQPGKLQEVAEQILQTEVQIVALQEIRWKGQGQIKKDKYILYYSCTEGQTGLRLKGKYHNITIINIHAPTEEKDDTKERFYAELQQIQEKTKI